MRTLAEEKLLKARQNYRDIILKCVSESVAPLSVYKTAAIKFQACNDLLSEYRMLHSTQRVKNEKIKFTVLR